MSCPICAQLWNDTTPITLAEIEAGIAHLEEAHGVTTASDDSDEDQ
jgi:hypothetical protein